jgi:low temperature requirement protein LtrA
VFARFAGLFAVVWWAWILYTLYANRFDTDDLIFRAAQSCAMLAIAVIAIDLHRVMHGRGGAIELASCYVVLRVVLVALYWRARHHVEGPGRDLSNVYIVGYSTTTGLWLLSIFLASPYRQVAWAAAMLIDLGVPMFAWPKLRGASVVISHLTERFGTFFIIVLGDAVIAVVAGVAGLRFSVDSSIVAAACFVIGLTLWWIYFDLTDTSVVGRGALGLTFAYAHFPLLAGITAFGAGTKLAITHATHHGLEAAARWALGGGIAAFALSLAAIYIGAEWTSMRDRTFAGRLVLAVVAITLAAAGGHLPPPVFAALLAVAMLGHLGFEAFTAQEGAATVIEPRPAVAEVAAEGSA